MSILVIKNYGKLTPGIHNNVKKGFKKFLIAEGYALVGSDENIKTYRENQAMYDKENEILNENKMQLCAFVENKFINIISAVNNTGNLYASITPQRIVDALKEQLLQDDKYKELLFSKYIIIPSKIIQEGIFSITIKFNKDAQCKFNVIVGHNDLVIKNMYLAYINEEKSVNNKEIFPGSNRHQNKAKPSLEIIKEIKNEEQIIEQPIQDDLETAL